MREILDQVSSHIESAILKLDAAQLDEDTNLHPKTVACLLQCRQYLGRAFAELVDALAEYVIYEASPQKGQPVSK